MTEVHRVVDKRLRPYEKNRYEAILGAGDNYVQVFPTSQVSASTIQVSCNPPNRNSIIDRHVMMQVNFIIVLTGTPSSGNINLLPTKFIQTDSGSGMQFLAGGISIRDFALSKVINSYIVNLGGTQITINLNEFASILPRFDNYWLEQSLLSGEPTMLDSMQRFELAANSSRDCSLPYDNITQYNTRGSFPILILTNTPTSASIQFTISEPIFLPPFLFEKGSDGPGLTGIDTMSITINFGAGNSGLNRILAIDPINGPTITNMVITPQPQLTSARLTFLKPSNAYPVKDVNYYPYYYIKEYNTVTNSLGPQYIAGVQNAAASALVQVNSIQLDSIPSCIYIYARIQNADLSPYIPDVFANINSIQINFAGKSGLLSTLTEQDLYNISVKNGYNATYSEWHGAQYQYGSVLKLIPGIDFPLDEGKAPGLQGSFNFQYTLGITNISNTAQIYQVETLAINEGTMTVDHGTVKTEVGFLTEAQIRHAPVADYGFTYSHHVLGGSFFSKIKDWGSAALKAIRGALDSGAIKNILPDKFKKYADYAKDASSKLHSVGLGTIGGKRKMKGGKKISKAELKKRAMGMGAYSQMIEEIDSDEDSQEDFDENEYREYQQWMKTNNKC